jgi:hypothetical protein
MISVDRRQFLKTATSLGLGAAMPLTVLSPALANPAVVILAVAAIVAGMIAAHNRRNVHTYVLAAIREELRVATMQFGLHPVWMTRG